MSVLRNDIEESIMTVDGEQWVVVYTRKQAERKCSSIHLVSATEHKPSDLIEDRSW
jgi:hypothetical protein